MVVVDKDTRLFESDGSFVNTDDVLLLINTISIIINSFPAVSIQVRQLQLELLRCGIHIINEQIEAIVHQMIKEGSITVTKWDNPN